MPYPPANEPRGQETRSIGRRTFAFVATEDWFFVSHFVGFAAVARDLGFDTTLICRENRGTDPAQLDGLSVVPFAKEKRYVTPLTLFRRIGEYRRIFREIRPEIVHAISLQTVIPAVIAARACGIRKIVAAPTGLGYTWVARSPTYAALRLLVALYAELCAALGVTFIFENPDDAAALGLQTASEGVFVVPGSGVPAEAFPPLPEPEARPIRIAVVARMLAMKGIRDAVAAIEAARAAGVEVELHLYGRADIANPTAIPEAELRDFSRTGSVTWHGHVTDVSAVWRDNHVAMLLSHGGEGLPRCLVEASASARPLIVTDVPGCRHAVTDGVEGLVVPVGDTKRIVEAIARLAREPQTRAAMGRAARARFEAQFSAEIVNARIRSIYARLATA